MTVDEKYAGTTAVSRLIWHVKTDYDFGSHVDDETIEFYAQPGAGSQDGELRVKDEGVGETKLSFSLRVKLGLADISEATVDQMADIISTSNVDYQQSLLGSMTSQTVSSWDYDDFVLIANSFDETLRGSFVKKLVDFEPMSWSQVKAFVGSYNQYESCCIGKRKSVSMSGYGTFDYILIGVGHDGDGVLTFMSASSVTTSALDSRSELNLRIGWNDLNIAVALVETTLYNSLPDDLKSIAQYATKKISTNGNVGSNNLTEKQVKMALISAKERGCSSYPEGVPPDGTTYEYFSSGGGLDVSSAYWTRSGSGLEYASTQTYIYFNNGSTTAAGTSDKLKTVNNVKSIVPMFFV